MGALLDSKATDTEFAVEKHCVFGSANNSSSLYLQFYSKPTNPKVGDIAGWGFDETSNAGETSLLTILKDNQYVMYMDDKNNTCRTNYTINFELMPGCK